MPEHSQTLICGTPPMPDQPTVWHLHLRGSNKTLCGLDIAENWSINMVDASGFFGDDDEDCQTCLVADTL